MTDDGEAEVFRRNRGCRIEEPPGSLREVLLHPGCSSRSEGMRVIPNVKIPLFEEWWDELQMPGLLMWSEGLLAKLQARPGLTTP